MAKKKYIDKLIGLKCIEDIEKNGKKVKCNHRNYYTTRNKKTAEAAKKGKLVLMKYCSNHHRRTKHQEVKISGK